MHLGNLVAQAIHYQPKHGRKVRVQDISRTCEIHIIAPVLAEPVIFLVVGALETERWAKVVTLRCVVIDHVQNNLDTGPVQGFDHTLEFCDLTALLAPRGIPAVRSKKTDSVIAPIIGEAFFYEVAVVYKMLDGHQLNCRYAGRLEMVHNYGMGYSGVRTPKIFGQTGVPKSQSFYMRLVNNTFR